MRRQVHGRWLVGVGPAWLLPGIAGAQERSWDWGWGMHPMGWMWGAWGAVAMAMMLAFWGLVIAALVLAVRWLLRQGERPAADRALEILRERYARGEISREEFEARRRDLL
jgi:putative membrane protein